MNYDPIVKKLRELRLKEENKYSNFDELVNHLLSIQKKYKSKLESFKPKLISKKKIAR